MMGSRRGPGVGPSMLACALTISGCARAAPVEFPEWSVGIPEGVPVVEYAPVPFAERTEHIGVVEDLVLGGQAGGDPNYLLASFNTFDIDDEGNLYVFDGPNGRIQVYGADGDWLRTIGGTLGEGPGDLGRRGLIAIVGDVLVYHDRQRMAQWSLEAGYLGESRAGVAPFGMQRMYGTSGGSVVGSYWITGESTRDEAFARVSLEGEVEHVYARFPRFRGFGALLFERRDGDRVSGVNTRMPVPTPELAVGSDSVYVTPGDEYQVLAFDVAGAPRWALRTAWPRPEVTQADIDRSMEFARRVAADAQPSEVDWPAFKAALDSPVARGPGLAVDGRGHLYVFPLMPPDLRPDERAVDVYGPDGERLFAGWIAAKVWRQAWGDFVYVAEPNPETEESQLVRYRLRAAFLE